MIKKVNKTSEKVYLIRIQPRDQITGKRVSFPIQYSKTKAEAAKIEADMWKEFKSGLNLGDANAVFAEEFQKYVNQRANTISPVTLKSWQDSANSFSDYFGKAKINSITTPLVSKYAHDYVDKHEVTVSKSSTIAKRLIHMRNFFKSIEGKTIKENPVPESPLKVFFRQSDFTLSKDWRIFTNDELTAIRNLITDDLKHSSINNWGSKLAILVESYTGMRVGELQALKFSNIVYENDVWTLRINNSWSDYMNNFTGSLKARPKGYSRTVLPLPEEAIILLQRYKDKQSSFLKEHDLSNESDLIFINLHDYKSAFSNEPIRQRSINDMRREICKRLKIEAGDKRMSLYSFRHSICTHLANVPGMSFTWAAEKMGHSLQMFMNTYVGVDPSIDKEMTKLWVS
ncbi:MAG: Integrase [Lactobacillus helveticus]|jgi:integrase|nr:site-specific integrase [Lactobacillus helveticus]NRN74891.1 Tyrosine recombinase XerD [Lactobacillus helveticus]NRO43556.1 Tyrosine recombinase XerD [Lactobacillus helveticus]NRO84947.1 Tyrosine recombinase XerD [Lactobacillus helveticus]